MLDATKSNLKLSRGDFVFNVCVGEWSVLDRKGLRPLKAVLPFHRPHFGLRPPKEARLPDKGRGRYDQGRGRGRSVEGVWRPGRRGGQCRDWRICGSVNQNCVRAKVRSSVFCRFLAERIAVARFRKRLKKVKKGLCRKSNGNHAKASGMIRSHWRTTTTVRVARFAGE